MYAVITTQVSIALKTGAAKVSQYGSTQYDSKYEAAQYACTQFTDNLLSTSVIDHADHYSGTFTWHMSDNKNTYVNHVEVEYV